MALKGCTMIELVDVNTGKVETIKHENMITNGILKALNKRGISNSAIFSNNSIPDSGASEIIVKNWFGGLFLFDKALNKDANDLFIPADTKCVGYAADKANSGINNLLGSYNTTESEYNKNEGYAKFVWDFATNQANGAISSLSLVPLEVAKMGWCNKNEENDSSIYTTKSFCQYVYDSTYAFSSDINADCYLCYDDTFLYGIERNNICYNSSNSALYFVNSKKLKLIKKQMQMQKVSIFGSAFSLNSRLLETIEIALPEEFVSVLSSTQNYTHIEYDSGFIYFYSSKTGYVEAGSTFKLLKISIDTLEVETITMTNTTGIRILTGSNWGDVQNKSSFSVTSDTYMRIVGNKLVVKDSSNSWWIIDLSDNTNIKQVTWTDGDVATSKRCTGYKYKKYLFIISTTPSVPTSSSSLFGVINTETGEAYHLNIRCLNTTFGLADNDYYDNYNFLVTHKNDEDMPHFYVRAAAKTSYTTWTQQWYFNPLILMTKNNLDSPVVKTPAQMMKITYTITEEFDE